MGKEPVLSWALSLGPMTSGDTGYGLGDLQAELRIFRDERDWARFHDPKSLALALVGEVGEVAELLQWIPADEAAARFREGRAHQRLGEELSDVLLYLLHLADVVGVDLLSAARAKLATSRERFRVEDVSGVAPDRVG